MRVALYKRASDLRSSSAGETAVQCCDRGVRLHTDKAWKRETQKRNEDPCLLGYYAMQSKETNDFSDEYGASGFIVKLRRSINRYEASLFRVYFCLAYFSTMMMEETYFFATLKNSQQTEGIMPQKT
jgi:hypothetical protein